MSAAGDARARALAFTVRQRLVRPGERVLVGVRHGASFGLLNFLGSVREHLGLAEVAGAAVESSTDEHSDAAEAVADAGRLVRKLGLTFHGIRPAGPPGAPVYAVRELVALAREQGFHRVALGHTLADDGLTVLRELLSGRGLVGVSGLAPRRRDGVIRPLLRLSPAEAYGLAAEMPGQRAPDDVDTRRSLLAELAERVMPRMRAIAPSAEASLARLGREIRAMKRVGREDARQRVTVGAQTDGTLVLPTFPDGGILAAEVAKAALAYLTHRPVRDADVDCLAGILAGHKRRQGITLVAGVMVTLPPNGSSVHLKGMIREGIGRADIRPRPGG